MKYIRKYLALLVFTLLIITQNSFSQEITDVSFEAVGEQIYVYYTLESSENIEFKISTILKRSSNASFNHLPERLSGDIGEGIYSGRKKKIVWSVNEDEMAMLDGEDFYFEIFAEKINTSSGGIPWYYFVGTAAVGGAAAAVLLGGSKDSKTTPTTNSFPAPPGRP